MKIISWQSLLTEHQIHIWRALQKKLGDDVSFVLGTEESNIRSQQGWSKVDVKDMTIIGVLPDTNWWKYGTEIILENLDALHVFGGFWADRRFFPLLLYAIKSGGRVVIMNEAYSENSSGYLQERLRLVSWIKVQLRPVLYRMAALILNYISDRRQFCILAIGLQSTKQFSRAGFKQDALFPFGYFVPKQKDVKRMPPKITSPLRLIFVGNLLKIKGLDVAIKAVEEINAQINSPAINLDIYGSGNSHDWLPTFSKEVTYRGVIPFGSAQSIIAQYDFLVLPSRHDGWGVVVNEALLQGVPVIISDRVGAKLLLEATHQVGMVFKSEDVNDLKQVLLKLTQEKDRCIAMKVNAMAVSKRISPVKAAVYMKKVFEYYFFSEGERPDVFWR